MKIFYFFRIDITVGDPDPHIVQVILNPIYICIALRLRQMDRHRFLYLVDFTVGSLDLVNGHLFLKNDTVCPSFHHNKIILCLNRVAQKNLRMIVRSHSSLNHAVNPASLLHGIVRRFASSVVNISAS